MRRTAWPGRARPMLAAAAVATAGTLLGGLLLATSAEAATNLALGRTTAVSSTETSSLGGDKAVDGSTSTRWASTEGTDPQWIRIDLGSSQQIGRVTLRWEAAYGKAYRIEVSPDASTWTTIYSTTTGNGGTDDLTGLTASGRYIRMYGTARGTTYGYSLYEFEVYAPTGTPSPSPSPTSSPPPGGVAVPFGSHLRPYAAGTLKLSGAASTHDQTVISYYNTWKNAFIKQNCGNGWYEVYSPDADHPYVAEAQGYGMVITALMAGADPNAKTQFDGLLKYVLAHPSVNNPNLHAAEQNTSCTSVNGSDSATDGDLEIAYGLLLADKQWGSTGAYNYKSLAVTRINAIKASEINATTKLTLLGDWSSAGDSYYYLSRTSDWMPGHFRAYRKATGDTAWDTILAKHQSVTASLQSGYAPNTGLLPDFVINTNTTPKPATGQVLEDPNDGKYWWNACRDPWRIGADAVTSGDAQSLAAARKLNTWVKAKTGGNPSNIAVGYSLDGTALSSGSEAAFFAPFAVTAMTDPGSQAWLDALWNKIKSTLLDTSGYYSASLQLQTMIVVSGNFWTP